LILEEMNATIDSEERNLNTLKLSGVFEGVKGLIFGKPEVYNNKNSNLEYIDIIKEVLGERNYPIIYNFDCGHTIPSLIISQDSLLSLKANHKTGVNYSRLTPYEC
ncbi:MAG: LD-carboxypeptidase, partial [Fusobacterium periodonticum]|nr:LD-carboxypeptidase [Fusobacterium periodonticum]